MGQHQWKVLLASTAAAALLLSGCGTGSLPAQSQGPALAASASASSESTADGTLRMTQEHTVTSDSYSGVPAYADFLAQAQPGAVVPGLKQGLIPQGMGCSSEGRLYVSGYFSADADLPSAIVALDAESGEFEAEYYLYQADGTVFSSHVGGLAVSESTLYVSAKLDHDNSYSVAAIPLSDLAETGSHNVTVKTLVPLPVSPSFLNVSGETLWIGNFYHPDKDYDLSPAIEYTTPSQDGDLGCYILGYRLDQEQEFLAAAGSGTAPVPDYVLAAPDRLQGMTLLGDGTVLLSQSYGRKNDSALLRYTLDLDDPADTEISVGGSSVDCWVLDSSRQTEALTAMPMTEALTPAPHGNVCYLLFESGAMHYSDGKYRTDCLWKLTLNE